AVDVFLNFAALPGSRVAEAGWLSAGVVGLAAFPCEAARAVSESIACFCCTAFNVFLVFSMASGFCPQAVPAAIPKQRIPVVSFIGSSTLSPAWDDPLYRPHLPVLPCHG